ncbi:hypothetical protein AC1031_021692 [Aphanomyces cochlioides]|nr:hypothetical protein AC1031_021692 [Aphanomyces cochlioides]
MKEQVSLPAAFDQWLATTFSTSPPPLPARKANKYRHLEPLEPRKSAAATSKSTFSTKSVQTPPQNRLSRRLDAEFAQWTYKDNEMQPGVCFFHFLKALNLLQVHGFLMPPTLATDGRGGFVWLTTCRNNNQFCINEFHSKAELMRNGPKILQKLTSSAQKALVLLKERQTNCHDAQNRTILLSSKAEVMDRLEKLQSTPKEFAALQAFIRPKGSKPWIIRVVWKAKSSRTYALVIADAVNEQITKSETATMDKSTSMASWTEPKAIVSSLVPHLEQAMLAKLKTVVVDFVQDQDSIWWFIQVKAFQIAAKMQTNQVESQQISIQSSVSSEKKAPHRLENPSLQSFCKGRVCGGQNTASSAFSVSFKEFLHVNYVQDQGNAPENRDDVGWDEFVDKLHRKERNRFYDRVPLCPACYPLYNTKKITKSAPKKSISALKTQKLLLSLEQALELYPVDETIQNQGASVERSPPQPQETQRNESPNRFQAEYDKDFNFRTIGDSVNEIPVEISALSLENDKSKAILDENPAIPEPIEPETFETHRSIDALWTQFAPPIAPFPPSLESFRAKTIAVLPQEVVSVDGTRYFYDDAYKTQILALTRDCFALSTAVRLESTGSDTLALHSIYLELQDDCADDTNALFGQETTQKYIVLTPLLKDGLK